MAITANWCNQIIIKNSGNQPVCVQLWCSFIVAQWGTVTERGKLWHAVLVILLAMAIANLGFDQKIQTIHAVLKKFK